MAAPLDSRQLRAFSILARTGSFTQTARELFLTQSAVSHSMKALEADVGCLLFDKVGKKAVLTQAGEQLLEHAERILSTMEQARADLGRLGKWGQSRLRLGATTTACQHLLPAVLREFQESFPKCSIQIEAEDTPQLLELLHAHKIDLAVSLEPMADDSFDFRSLFQDELMFLVSLQHPWAMLGRVKRDTIAQQNFILYGKRSYTTRMIEEYFAEEDIVLHSRLELGNMEAIKELVKLGLGTAILAPWTAREELETGSLMALPLGRRKLRRRWGVLSARARRLSLVEETFIGLCESVGQALKLGDAGDEIKNR